MQRNIAMAGPALRKKAIIATHSLYDSVKQGRVRLNTITPDDDGRVSVNKREWLADTHRRLQELMRLDDVLRGQGL